MHCQYNLKASDRQILLAFLSALHGTNGTTELHSMKAKESDKRTLHGASIVLSPSAFLIVAIDKLRSHLSIPCYPDHAYQ